MKHGVALLTGGAACAMLAAEPAQAQQAGDSYVEVSAARTKLIDRGDVYVSGTLDPNAGYSTRETYHGVFGGGYFLFDGVALEASIATPATTDNIPAGSLAGTPNLGSDEFVIATVGGKFQPLKGSFSPYIGGGLQFQFTTQERDGLAVGLDIPNAHGPYVAAGVEYQVNNRWGIFADVRKAFYHTNASGKLPTDATYTSFLDVDAKAELDPLTIRFGARAHFGRGADADRIDFSDDGAKLIVRAGMTSLELADKADLVVGGAPLPGATISTFEHRTPSIQVGYRLLDKLSVNATVGLPPKIGIYGAGTIGGLPKLGEATYGPTAFTLQYQFTRAGRIRPYVGAGVSYMIVFDTTDGAFEDLHIDNDLAPAFEAGTDIQIGRSWGLFVDVKKALLRPRTTGTFQGLDVVASTKLDPWVFSTGLSLGF